MKIELLELHQKALEIANRFRKAESELIEILQKIDEFKAFRELGFTSTFDYAVKALKLSEANAYNFITVARKSKVVPELKEAIDSGIISVSTARKITPVLTDKNKDHWLTLAAELSKNKLEKEVAKILPQKAVNERTSYVTEDRVKLTLGISEEILALLKRVQNLESQRTGGAASYEESLKAALDLYVEKNDPVKKAERSLKNSSGRTRPVPGQAAPFQRTQLPQDLKHQVFLRDQGRCTHMQNTKDAKI